VPFADNQNDARIFCSHGSQLRPAILGWHGRPPEEGDETTLFLEGKNFSIHDTHVIAGGKPATAVLVSRQLLEVTIPRDACPTPSAQGTPLLDINVATPNGVSNHLLIKMRSRQPHVTAKLEEKIEKTAEHELRHDAKVVAAAVALDNAKKDDKKPPQPALDTTVIPKLLVPLR
jgi:hypothetical protein